MVPDAMAEIVPDMVGIIRMEVVWALENMVRTVHEKRRGKCIEN